MCRRRARHVFSLPSVCTIVGQIFLLTTLLRERLLHEIRLVFISEVRETSVPSLRCHLFGLYTCFRRLVTPTSSSTTRSTPLRRGGRTARVSSPRRYVCERVCFRVMLVVGRQERTDGLCHMRLVSSRVAHITVLQDT